MIYTYDGVRLEPAAMSFAEAEERACEWWAAHGCANPYIADRRHWGMKLVSLLDGVPCMRKWIEGFEGHTVPERKAEKTGQELMHEALPKVTLLDSDLHNIMRMVDTYAAYRLSAARWGNEYSDEDGARAHYRMIEGAIRALADKARGEKI